MPSAFWLPSCRKRRRKRSIRLTCGGLRAAAFLCLPLFRRKTSPCFPPDSLLFSAPYRTLPPAYAPPTDRFLRRISARRPAAEKQGCPSQPGRLHALPVLPPGSPRLRPPPHGTGKRPPGHSHATPHIPETCRFPGQTRLKYVPQTARHFPFPARTGRTTGDSTGMSGISRVRPTGHVRCFSVVGGPRRRASAIRRVHAFRVYPRPDDARVLRYRCLAFPAASTQETGGKTHGCDIRGAEASAGHQTALPLPRPDMRRYARLRRHVPQPAGMTGTPSASPMLPPFRSHGLRHLPRALFLLARESLSAAFRCLSMGTGSHVPYAPASLWHPS